MASEKPRLPDVPMIVFIDIAGEGNTGMSRTIRGFIDLNVLDKPVFMQNVYA